MGAAGDTVALDPADSRLDVEDLEFIKDRLKIITRQVHNCIEISRRYLSFLRRQTDDGARVGINQLLSDLGDVIRVHPALQNNQFQVRPMAADGVAKANGTEAPSSSNDDDAQASLGLESEDNEEET